MQIGGFVSIDYLGGEKYNHEIHISLLHLTEMDLNRE